jgi:hypothetical protein
MNQTPLSFLEGGERTMTRERGILGSFLTTELGCPTSRSFFARGGSTAMLRVECRGSNHFFNRRTPPPTQAASEKVN